MKTGAIILFCLSTVTVFGQWSTTGSNIYSTNSGNVGIGIDPPLEKLHINGSVRGNGDGGALRISTSSGWLDLGSINASWAHLQTDRPKFYFNKSLYVNGAVSSYNTLNLDLQTDGTTRMTIDQNSGFVGIGVTEPKQALHVKGRIYLQGTEAYPNGWLQNYFHWRGHSLILGTEPGQYNHNKIELKPGGSTAGILESVLEMYRAMGQTEHQLKIRS